MPKFGKTSQERLATCHPDLRRLFERIVVTQDCTILCGHRNEVTQNNYFASGNSKVEWPDSKHNVFPSNAVDASPYPIPKEWGANEPKELVKFYQFAAIVIYEAKKMGIDIRWGGDWDMDGDYTDQDFDDLVHFELR